MIDHADWDLITNPLKILDIAPRGACKIARGQLMRYAPILVNLLGLSQMMKMSCLVLSDYSRKVSNTASIHSIKPASHQLKKSSII